MTDMEYEESEKLQPPDSGRKMANDVQPIQPDHGPAGTRVTITFNMNKFKKIKDEVIDVHEDLAVVDEVWFGKKEAKEIPEKSARALTVIVPEKANGGPDKVKIWIQLDYDFIYVGDFTYEEEKAEALKPEAKTADEKKVIAQAKSKMEEAQKVLAQAEAQIAEARIAEARKVLERQEAQRAEIAEAEKLVQEADAGKSK